MVFVTRRIKILTLVTAGVILLAGLAFSSLAFSPRQAAQASSGHSEQGFYVQTNLVSDLPNIAKFQDPNLVNSWGLVHGPNTPWWVADNVTGKATVYDGDGRPFPHSSPRVVTIPLPVPPPAGATAAAPNGIVFNNTSGFVVSKGSASGPSV